MFSTCCINKDLQKKKDIRFPCLSVPTFYNWCWGQRPHACTNHAFLQTNDLLHIHKVICKVEVEAKTVCTVQNNMLLGKCK